MHWYNLVCLTNTWEKVVFHILIALSILFFCVCQVGEIGSISGFFCQTVLSIHRLHCLSSVFWFGSLSQLGICAVWSRLSKFPVQSDFGGGLLISRWRYIHKVGRHTCFLWLKWYITDLYMRTFFSINSDIRCAVFVLKKFSYSGVTGSRYYSMLLYGVVWVDILFLLVWYRWTIAVDWLLGKFF